MTHYKKSKLILITIGIFFTAKALYGAAVGVHPEYNIGRQKITRKNILILEQELEFIQRDRGTSIIWETSIAYGITKNIGVRLFIPVFLKRKIDEHTSHGLSDISLEAIFIKFLRPYNVAAFTAGFFAPTGSTTTTPQLGTGAFNLIITAEFLHSSPHWYAAFLLRPIISIERKGRKPGSILNFQYLFGPKFNLCNSKAPLAVVMEIDGAFRKQTKRNGIIEKNSGGTIIVCGPLVSSAYGNFILQGRVLLPIVQNFKGRQPKTDFIAGLNVQYYF